MRRDFAVAAHFHSRQAFQQVLHYGVGLGLVGVGVVFHRVLHHLHLGAYSRHFGVAQHDGVFLDGDFAKVDGGVVNAERHRLCLVAHIRYLCHIFTASHSREAEMTVYVAHHALHQAAVACRQQLHRGAYQRGLVGVVNEQTLDVGSRSEDCGKKRDYDSK